MWETADAHIGVRIEDSDASLDWSSLNGIERELWYGVRGQYGIRPEGYNSFSVKFTRENADQGIRVGVSRETSDLVLGQDQEELSVGIDHNGVIWRGGKEVSTCPDWKQVVGSEVQIEVQVDGSGVQPSVKFINGSESDWVLLPNTSSNAVFPHVLIKGDVTASLNSENWQATELNTRTVTDKPSVFTLWGLPRSGKTNYINDLANSMSCKPMILDISTLARQNMSPLTHSSKYMNAFKNVLKLAGLHDNRSFIIDHHSGIIVPKIRKEVRKCFPNHELNLSVHCPSMSDHTELLNALYAPDDVQRQLDVISKAASKAGLPNESEQWTNIDYTCLSAEDSQLVISEWKKKFQDSMKPESLLAQIRNAPADFPKHLKLRVDLFVQDHKQKSEDDFTSWCLQVKDALAGRDLKSLNFPKVITKKWNSTSDAVQVPAKTNQNESTDQPRPIKVSWNQSKAETIASELEKMDHTNPAEKSQNYKKLKAVLANLQTIRNTRPLDHVELAWLESVVTPELLEKFGGIHESNIRLVCKILKDEKLDSEEQKTIDDRKRGRDAAEKPADEPASKKTKFLSENPLDMYCLVCRLLAFNGDDAQERDWLFTQFKNIIPKLTPEFAEPLVHGFAFQLNVKKFNSKQTKLLIDAWRSIDFNIQLTS